MSKENLSHLENCRANARPPSKIEMHRSLGEGKLVDGQRKFTGELSCTLVATRRDVTMF